MDSPASAAVLPRSAWGRDLLLLTIVFGALYFFRLGSYPLSNPDEGRYAEVPREMLATGDWVTPRLDGVNYFEKPPLVYWVTAVFEKIFGANEWAVRAVPALFALGGILLTYAAARGLYDRLTGWASATVLGTCVLWFIVGHIPLLDTAMSVWMSGTLFCFILGVQAPPGPKRRWLLLGMYVCAALATLTKGMIGFLVTGAVMFLWVLLFNRWKRLLPLYLPSGIAVFLAVALPWHVLAALHNATWVHRYLVFEHFLRFLTPAASRHGPWHYFLWVVVGGLMPWTGFMWPQLRQVFAAGWKRREAHAVAWFLIIWVGFIVLFFSTSKSKLVPYVLPVFPALAVLAGVEIARSLRANAAGTARVGFRVFAFFAGALGLALAVFAARPALFRVDPAQAAALRVPAGALAVLLFTLGVVVLWLAKHRPVRSAVVTLAVGMAAFFAVLQFAAPALNKPGTADLKDLAQWVKTHATTRDRVYDVYDYYQNFSFYAARLVGVVGRNHAELELEEDPAARASGRFISDEELLRQWQGDERIFLVVQKRKLAEVREHAPTAGEGSSFLLAPNFHYHVIVDRPYYMLLSNRP